MKKTLHRILIVSLCTLIPTMLYLKTPSIEDQSIKLNDTRVVIVNEDEGVLINGQPYNFAQAMIDNLIKESEFDVSSENFADAFSLLEKGKVKYIILFDAKFSESINSFDRVNQVKGKVSYYYNHTYDTSVNGNIESENERNAMFELLQNDISTVYNKTIISKVEESKEMLRDDIDSDVELSEEIRNTSEDNSKALTSEIDASNKHISGFKNEMGEKITLIDGNIKDSTEIENVIINSAIENGDNIEGSIIFYDGVRTNVENTYNNSLEEYLKYSNLLVGEDGVATYITNESLPVYAKYDQQYKSNLSILNSIISYDESEIGSICNSDSDHTELKNRVTNLKVNYVDKSTKELKQESLFSTTEAEELFVNISNSCSEKFDIKSTEYNIGSTDALNKLYVSNKNILLTEIIEEANLKSININSFQNSNVVIEKNRGDDAPSTSVKLSANQVSDFNAYNILIAILEEDTNYAKINYDSNKDYYMSTTNNANFDTLKTIVKSEYSLYGGTYSNVRDIINGSQLGSVNNFYGLNTLNVLDNHNLSYIKSEYNDISKETKLLTEYGDSIFYHHLEKSLVNKLGERFFAGSVNSMSMEEYNNFVANYITISVGESSKLIEDYEKLHGDSLTKLNDDSELIIASYEKSDGLNSMIMESGYINLENYKEMENSSTLLKEENRQIIEHTSQVKENNSKINETVKENEEKYSKSLEKLEEANEEQEKFVSDYEQILSKANQNGINNNSFYEYITNPVEFENNDVGDNVTALNSYFIVLWLFIGLLFINTIYSKYKEKFTLKFSSGDFKESWIQKFMNEHLLYFLTVILFGLIYSFVLVQKFEIISYLLFIIEVTVLSLMISYIMKKIIKKFNFYGYLTILFAIAIMYILLFMNGDSTIIRVISIPVVMMDNFIKVHIYNIPYQNSFVYTLSIFGFATVLVIVFDIISKRRVK